MIIWTCLNLYWHYIFIIISKHLIINGVTNHLESLTAAWVLELLYKDFLNTNIILSKSSEMEKFKEKISKSQFNSLVLKFWSL